MTPSIVRVHDAVSFDQFHNLLVEYESSLDRDMRHRGETDRTSVEKAYREPNAAFLALVEGEAAGCIALVEINSSTAVIQRLFVRLAQRNLGIARVLVVAAIGACRERRYDRIVLDTDRQRLATAYNLYRSLGFRDCEAYGAVDYATPTFMELILHLIRFGFRDNEQGPSAEVQFRTLSARFPLVKIAKALGSRSAATRSYDSFSTYL